MDPASQQRGTPMTASVQRKFTRSHHDFHVQLAAGGNVHHVTSRDLSLGGVGLSGCPALTLGEPVKLFVSAQAHRFEGCRLLLLWAIPVWQRGGDVGLRFIDVPADVTQDLCFIMN